MEPARAGTHQDFQGGDTCSSTPCKQHATNIRRTRAQQGRQVLMKEIQATQLRIVDPYEDPHIWAVVDDGCNSSYHTRLWRDNAEKKFAKLNFQCHFVSSETTTLKGVGEKKTIGKWRTARTSVDQKQTRHPRKFVLT